MVYELQFALPNDGGRPVLSGLIDVEKLRYDGKKSASESQRSGSGRPQVGVGSGAIRTATLTSWSIGYIEAVRVLW